MRTKEEILKDLGVTDEYNAHAGIPADTKEVIFAEIFIDIRDILNRKPDNLKAAEIDNETVKLIHSDKE